MKKSFALFLSLFYLVFSFGSLRAEASLFENKESQENIFSVKQSEENAVNHFAETPSPKKQITRNSGELILPGVRIQPSSCCSQVPLFLRNCNFRR
jgi:hypothetical protein